MAPAAGIIGGLLSYIVINGANLLLDKLAECMHWSIAGTDAQPSGAGGSFISRLQSNTGGAAQARPHLCRLTACLASDCQLWQTLVPESLSLTVAQSESDMADANALS